MAKEEKLQDSGRHIWDKKAIAAMKTAGVPLEFADWSVQQREQYATKSGMFKKPNYEKLEQDGADRVAVYFIKKVFDMIPKEPQLAKDLAPDNYNEVSIQLSRANTRVSKVELYIHKLEHNGRIRPDEEATYGSLENAKAELEEARLEQNKIQAAYSEAWSTTKYRAQDCYIQTYSAFKERLETCKTFVDCQKFAAWAMNPNTENLSQNQYPKKMRDFFNWKVSEYSLKTEMEGKNFLFKEDDFIKKLYQVVEVKEGTVEVEDKHSVKVNSSSGYTRYFQAEFCDESKWKQGSFALCRSECKNGSYRTQREIIGTNFETYEAAIEAAKQHEQELATEKKNTPKREKIEYVPRQLLHVQRHGEDYREGKDVKNADFEKTFGVDTIRFGNYENEVDRQVGINMCYDALKDMAVALNVSDDMISLGKQLAMAFGANGSGNALAHFEPLQNLINITKVRGAGTLGHEWAHALDFYIADTLNSRFNTLKDLISKEQKSWDTAYDTALQDYAKENGFHLNDSLERDQARRNLDTLISRGDNERYKELGNLQKQVNENIQKYQEEQKKYPPVPGFALFATEGKSPVMKDVMDTIMKQDGKPTKFYEDALILDRKCKKISNGRKNEKGKGYWASETELFARAFHCYLKDKLEGMGITSDYLCGVSDFPPVNIKGEEVCASPQGKEREVINQAFDRLIDKLKELDILQQRTEEPKKEMTSSTVEIISEEELAAKEAKKAAPKKEKKSSKQPEEKEETSELSKESAPQESTADASSEVIEGVQLAFDDEPEEPSATESTSPADQNEKPDLKDLLEEHAKEAARNADDLKAKTDALTKEVENLFERVETAGKLQPGDVIFLPGTVMTSTQNFKAERTSDSYAKVDKVESNGIHFKTYDNPKCEGMFNGMESIFDTDMSGWKMDLALRNFDPVDVKALKEQTVQKTAEDTPVQSEPEAIKTEAKTSEADKPAPVISETESHNTGEMTKVLCLNLSFDTSQFITDEQTKALHKLAVSEVKKDYETAQQKVLKGMSGQEDEVQLGKESEYLEPFDENKMQCEISHCENLYRNNFVGWPTNIVVEIPKDTPQDKIAETAAAKIEYICAAKLDKIESVTPASEQQVIAQKIYDDIQNIIQNDAIPEVIALKTAMPQISVANAASLHMQGASGTEFKTKEGWEKAGFSISEAAESFHILKADIQTDKSGVKQFAGYKEIEVYDISQTNEGKHELPVAHSRIQQNVIAAIADREGIPCFKEGNYQNDPSHAAILQQYAEKCLGTDKPISSFGAEPELHKVQTQIATYMMETIAGIPDQGYLKKACESLSDIMSSTLSTTYQIQHGDCKTFIKLVNEASQAANGFAMQYRALYKEEEKAMTPKYTVQDIVERGKGEISVSGKDAILAIPVKGDAAIELLASRIPDSQQRTNELKAFYSNKVASFSVKDFNGTIRAYLNETPVKLEPKEISTVQARIDRAIEKHNLGRGQ